jgi:glycolate oxidase FAD binding subunit
MSTLAASETIVRELGSIVGERNVTLDALSINGVTPTHVVAPASAEECAQVLAFANNSNLVVAPAGGMTKQDIGGVPERIDILLSTTRLCGVEHYDPGDLTIGVNAGMTFGEVQRTLGEHLQWLPYDAANLDHATVGGCVATGATGPLKHAFGGLRDFCIGVQFVTADGKVAKGGGRVVKNVAGYDLMKLMNGSFGTLAVITRAAFKVFPRPRQTRSFICKFKSLDEALQFRTKMFQSPLTFLSMELISPQGPEYLSEAREPNDPDHYAPSAPVSLKPTTWQVALRATGSDNVLARYQRDLGSVVTLLLDGADEERFWKNVACFEQNVLGRHRNALVVYTHLAIQNVGPALHALERVATDYNFIPAVVGRAATGNLVIALLPLSVDPPSAMQYANCVSAYRGMLPQGSSAEVAHCPVEAKGHFDIWGTSTSDITMMRAVKNAIDPKNILNRGRFII